MSIWESILLGIIQGIFMFFPVSSTSHLVLTQHWLIQQGSALPSPDSPEMILFDLVVHVGTLISIVVVFRRSLSRMMVRIWKDLWYLEPDQATTRGARLKLRLSAMRSRSLLFPSGQREGDRLYLRLAILGLFSVFVTAAVGFPLRSIFKTFFAEPLALSATLTITGILLWCTDAMKNQSRGLRALTPKVAAIIGLAQGLALIPGLSRSGMTISFALFTRLKRQWAAEYSFFIAFPTILAATFVQGLEVLGTDTWTGISWLTLSIGFVVAAIVGIGALQMVLTLLYRARFRFFSYYVWTLSILIAVGVYQGVL